MDKYGISIMGNSMIGKTCKNISIFIKEMDISLFYLRLVR